ncbi:MULTISPECIES: class E sortase [unclassified Arthrobacter]|uniref:class E sortase n=1 Tax=unclassified Arthrobacter TaxID=235627 RepID=UPI000CE42E20|nr:MULTISPECIES: class E sortase [unclassified Arthrobacter]
MTLPLKFSQETRVVRSPSHVESAVGVEELITGNENVRRRNKRSAQRQRAKRPKQGFFRTLIQIIGELLITCGVILLLFVVWELWWTNIEANTAQQAAVSQFAQDFQGPVTPPAPDAPPVDYGVPKVMAAPEQPSTVFGVVYIPRFGQTYSRPLVEGTAPAQLDTLGLGRYDSSAMPGEVGNFAVAGHRQTHGAVLDAVHTLVPGDKIYVQTNDGYYTYVFRNNQIVMPNRGDVIAPVPTQPGVAPTERFMTMTSCNPRFGAEERIISYSVMESWQPASAGPPAEIAAQVAANQNGKG